MFCNKEVVKYGLHDTNLCGVEISDGRLILTFRDGVYVLDGGGKELSLSAPCRLELDICDLTDETAWQHIEVYNLSRGKHKEIGFFKFVTMLEENPLNIDLDYYSDIARSIMLTGFIGKTKICFKITDIESVNYAFE